MSSYVVECDQLLGPASVVCADGMENAVADQSGEELLYKEHQQATTNEREVEVVNHERPIQREGFAVFH